MKEIVNYLDEISATLKTSGGSSAASALPEVTASNNGQALLVSGGKWVAGALPTELPAVTASDNGSVLTVVNGQWAVAALPGG